MKTKNNTKKLVATTSAKLHARAKVASARRGLKLQEWIIEAVEAQLTREEEQQHDN